MAHHDSATRQRPRMGVGREHRLLLRMLPWLGDGLTPPDPAADGAGIHPLYAVQPYQKAMFMLLAPLLSGHIPPIGHDGANSSLYITEY